MQVNHSNASIDELQAKLRASEEEQKHLQELIRIQELREKLRESQEEQKRLQMLLQQAEVAVQQPESEDTSTTRVSFQDVDCQGTGGPDCETPRAQPACDETTIACVPPSQAAAKAVKFNCSAFLKSHSLAKRYSEETMKMNLDLDSPALDEEGMQQCREAFTAVEGLLHAAAQHVFGPNSEPMVETEVIGACAVAPVSASDVIDVLCKVSQISGQQLFTIFKQMLEADPSASCVREHPEVITGSALSGLRFSYAKFQFRMFVAKVPWEEDDEETFHSLTGCLLVRSLTEIISINDSFGLALRMVKFWAQRRGIYGSAFGYPDGLAWSICLARVCQMYPRANAAELVVRFFKVYSSWDWRTAVSLLPLDGCESLQYDPVEEGKIAVMTPGGSPTNIAAHVKTSALPVLQEELQRAYKLSKRIAKGDVCWSDVYAMPNIAQKHKHYMRLEFVAQTKQALDLLVEWGQISLPTLLNKFESELPHVQTRVWSQPMPVQHESYAFACSIIIGLRFTRTEASKQLEFDLRVPTVGFLEMLDIWPYKDYFAGQYDLTVQHIRRHELQQWWKTYVGDSSLAPKQLSDSQSDENCDGTDYTGQVQLALPRWSDSIDENGMCIECY